MQPQPSLSPARRRLSASGSLQGPCGAAAAPGVTRCHHAVTAGTATLLPSPGRVALTRLTRLTRLTNQEFIHRQREESSGLFSKAMLCERLAGFGFAQVPVSGSAVISLRSSLAEPPSVTTLQTQLSPGLVNLAQHLHDGLGLTTVGAGSALPGVLQSLRALRQLQRGLGCSGQTLLPH